MALNEPCHCMAEKHYPGCFYYHSQTQNRILFGNPNHELEKLKEQVQIMFIVCAKMLGIIDAVNNSSYPVGRADRGQELNDLVEVVDKVRKEFENG